MIKSIVSIFDLHIFIKGKLGIRIEYRVTPAGHIGPGESAKDPADADDENIDDLLGVYGKDHPAGFFDDDDDNLDDKLGEDGKDHPADFFDADDDNIDDKFGEYGKDQPAGFFDADDDNLGEDEKDQPAGFFGFFRRRARSVAVCFVGNTVATMNQSISELESRKTVIGFIV